MRSDFEIVTGVSMASSMAWVLVRLISIIRVEIIQVCIVDVR